MTVPESISMETMDRVASILRVISHPVRLKLIELLEFRHMTVGELAQETGLAPHACSQHLRIMQARNVLASKREGKTVYYEVICPQALHTIHCIREHGGR